MNSLVILSAALALAAAAPRAAEVDCGRPAEGPGAVGGSDPPAGTGLHRPGGPSGGQHPPPGTPTLPAHSPLTGVPWASAGFDSLSRNHIHSLSGNTANVYPSFGQLPEFALPGGADSIGRFPLQTSSFSSPVSSLFRNPPVSLLWPDCFRNTINNEQGTVLKSWPASYVGVPQQLSHNELHKVGNLHPDTFTFAGSPVYGLSRAASVVQIPDTIHIGGFPVHGAVHSTAPTITGRSPTVEGGPASSAGTSSADSITFGGVPLIAEPKVASDGLIPGAINFDGVPVQAASLPGTRSANSVTFGGVPLFGQPRVASDSQIPGTVNFGGFPLQPTSLPGTWSALGGSPLFAQPRVASQSQIPETINFAGIPVHGAVHATDADGTGSSPSAESGPATLPVSESADLVIIGGQPWVASNSRILGAIKFNGVPVQAASLPGTWSANSVTFGGVPLFGQPRAASDNHIPGTINFGGFSLQPKFLPGTWSAFGGSPLFGQPRFASETLIPGTINFAGVPVQRAVHARDADGTGSSPSAEGRPAASPGTVSSLTFGGVPLFGQPRAASESQISDHINFSAVPVRSAPLPWSADSVTFGGAPLFGQPKFASDALVTGPSPPVEGGPTSLLWALSPSKLTFSGGPLIAATKVASNYQNQDTVNFGGVPVHRST